MWEFVSWLFWIGWSILTYCLEITVWFSTQCIISLFVPLVILHYLLAHPVARQLVLEVIPAAWDATIFNYKALRNQLHIDPKSKHHPHHPHHPHHKHNYHTSSELLKRPAFPQPFVDSAHTAPYANASQSSLVPPTSSHDHHSTLDPPHDSQLSAADKPPLSLGSTLDLGRLDDSSLPRTKPIKKMDSSYTDSQRATTNKLTAYSIESPPSALSGLPNATSPTGTSPSTHPLSSLPTATPSTITPHALNLSHTLSPSLIDGHSMVPTYGHHLHQPSSSLPLTSTHGSTSALHDHSNPITPMNVSSLSPFTSTPITSPIHNAVTTTNTTHLPSQPPSSSSYRFSPHSPHHATSLPLPQRPSRPPHAVSLSSLNSSNLLTSSSARVLLSLGVDVSIIKCLIVGDTFLKYGRRGKVCLLS